MLSKAYFEERRSLWYSNGRIIKVEHGIKGFHHRHMIKLNGQYCEVYQAKHQGISLLLQDGT
jgi:hypothetical protein